MNNEFHHHTPRTLRQDIRNFGQEMSDHPNRTAAILAVGTAATLGFTGALNEVRWQDTCVASDQEVTVQDGEIFSDLALRVNPDEDPGVTMRHLEAVNPELTSTNVLQRGEVLNLPLCGDDIQKE